MVKLEDTLGALAVGSGSRHFRAGPAEGRFTLSDNSGEKVIADRMLTPASRCARVSICSPTARLFPPAALLAAGIHDGTALPGEISRRIIPAVVVSRPARAGDRLRIVDTQGQQAVDFLCYTPSCRSTATTRPTR